MQVLWQELFGKTIGMKQQIVARPWLIDAGPRRKKLWTARCPDSPKRQANAWNLRNLSFYASFRDHGCQCTPDFWCWCGRSFVDDALPGSQPCVRYRFLARRAETRGLLDLSLRKPDSGLRMKSPSRRSPTIVWSKTAREWLPAIYTATGLCDLYFCNLEGANRLFHNIRGIRFEESPLWPASVFGTSIDGRSAGGRRWRWRTRPLGQRSRCGDSIVPRRWARVGEFVEKTDSGLLRDSWRTIAGLAHIDGDGDLDVSCASKNRGRNSGSASWRNAAHYLVER